MPKFNYKQALIYSQIAGISVLAMYNAYSYLNNDSIED